MRGSFFGIVLPFFGMEVPPKFRRARCERPIAEHDVVCDAR
jgi:hypothetical protein